MEERVATILISLFCLSIVLTFIYRMQIRNLGSGCSLDINCGYGSYCKTGKCACKFGYISSKKENCKLVDCHSDIVCELEIGPQTECQEGQCHKWLYPSANNSVNPRKCKDNQISYFWTSGQLCSDRFGPNFICNSYGYCACEFGYRLNRATKTCEKVKKRNGMMVFGGLLLWIVLIAILARNRHYRQQQQQQQLASVQMPVFVPRVDVTLLANTRTNVSSIQTQTQTQNYTQTQTQTYTQTQTQTQIQAQFDLPPSYDEAMAMNP